MPRTSPRTPDFCARPDRNNGDACRQGLVDKEKRAGTRGVALAENAQSRAVKLVPSPDLMLASALA